MHRVLLVDDIQLVLSIQKSWLEERRLEVAVARSAGEALSLLQEFQPNLIVVDYEMPEMDGVQFCQKIKADGKLYRIPIIILSAHTDDVTIRRCLAAGAAAFVSKTGGREELLNNIANVLHIPYRRHMRLKCSVSARIKGKRSENEQGMIKDISVSGLLLVTSRPMAVGTELDLHFMVPRQPKEINIPARVVRTEEPQGGRSCCGVQFLEMDVEFKRQIRQFVEHSI